MTIPSVIDTGMILEGLSNCLNRTNNPKNLLVTLAEHDARNWEARLRHMDDAERLADRVILLSDSQSD